MTALIIPAALKDEFVTVEAIWELSASTRGLDALILTWVKYEKQTRKLFGYLVQQHFGPDTAAQAAVRATILANRQLNPKSHLAGIVSMAGNTEMDLIGAAHAQLAPEIERIHRLRNKLLHGQLTGQKLDAVRLEADVLYVIAWMIALADAGTREFGYDGLERNTALSRFVWKRACGRRAEQGSLEGWKHSSHKRWDWYRRGRLRRLRSRRRRAASTFMSHAVRSA